MSAPPETDKSVPLLFVYGTLKRGLHNHAFLAGQEYVGPARTLPHYHLYHCGPYPGLVAAESGVAVDGELWRVDEETLRRLDDFEGVPAVFDRRLIPLEGRDESAFVYFYVKAVGAFSRCAAWPPG